jgi:hypothetical protein
MGAGQSSLSTSSGPLTREMVLKSTEQIRLVIDYAMRVMLEKITPRDLLNLANPNECSKYVIVIGNAFDHLFRSIDVVPLIKGKAPQTIYFQKLDILAGRTSTGSKEVDEMYKQHRLQICKVLAYFFTRFFQIFAALALSVFDDANVASYGTGQLLPSGFQMPGAFGPVFGRGGGDDGYSSANEEQLQQQSGGGTIQEVFDRILESTKRTVKTLDGDTYADFRKMRVSNVSGLEVYYRESPSDVRQGRISLVDGGSEKLAVKVGIQTQGNYFKVNPQIIYRQYGRSTTIDGIYTMEFKFDNERYMLSSTTARFIKGSNYKLSTAIYEMLNYFHNRSGSSDFEELIRRDKTEERKVRYSNPDEKFHRRWEYGGITRSLNSGQIPSEIRPIFEALHGQTRPVAHCIARSLQLVSLDALAGQAGRQAFSHICNVKFLGTKPTGLPEPGKELSGSSGMRALETLFKVMGPDGTAQLTDETRQEYLDFLQKLGHLYQPGRQVSEQSFTKLINESDKRLCSRLQDTQRIMTLTGAEMEIAKQGVMALWKRQLEHAREVDRTFAQMFIVDGTNQIRIHPNILHLGVPGLDAIAAHARQVLAKYYVDCEGAYQESAMKIMLTRFPPAAPTPAAAAAAPAPVKPTLPQIRQQQQQAAQARGVQRATQIMQNPALAPQYLPKPTVPKPALAPQYLPKPAVTGPGPLK